MYIRVWVDNLKDKVVKYKRGLKTSSRHLTGSLLLIIYWYRLSPQTLMNSGCNKILAQTYNNPKLIKEKYIRIKKKKRIIKEEMKYIFI